MQCGVSDVVYMLCDAVWRVDILTVLTLMLCPCCVMQCGVSTYCVDVDGVYMPCDTLWCVNILS